MAQTVYSYILHQDGKIDDTAFELISAAKKIVPDATVTAIAVGSGSDFEAACNELSASYQDIWKIDHEALSYPNAEIIRGLLTRIIPQGSIVLLPHEHFGMDLSPGLSIKLNASFLPDAIDFEGMEDGKLKAIREEYSGQVSTHLLCDITHGAVITIRPGAFQADESKGESGTIVDKTADAIQEALPGQPRRYLELVEAEVGDVDITKSEVLVSVGRGIDDEENLEMVNELAETMGGDVSCSRPIVDAKWMEKSRQVGTSGQTVKPRVYLALGISGSFQHMGGVKGAPYVIAVNKNAKAPIFQQADVGVVGDILEFIPMLTDKIKETKG